MISKAHSPQGYLEYGGYLGFEAGEMVCTDCGLIVSEYRIDHGPEWRSFANGNHNLARTGAPFTYSRHDRGLSAEIGRSIRIKGRKHRQLAHMCRQHNHARTSTRHERNQVYVFTEIRRITGALLLPNHIHDQVCSLFKSAQNEGLLHDRSFEGFTAACVYVACRVVGVSRSVEEICDMSKAIKAGHRAAYGAPNRDPDLPITPTDPTEYLPQFATKLDLDSDTERRAREHIAEACDEGLVNGKNPCSIATVCLYTTVFDCSEDCTQAEATGVADVTPVTPRKTCVVLRE